VSAHVARALFAALVLTGCARAPAIGAPVAPRQLRGTDGAAHEVPSRASDSRFTVLVFFAAHCPCQAAHDPRLVALYARYHSLGVDFFAVDPETGVTAERDAQEAARRGYPFPLVLDEGGALARQLGADVATESFVLDRTGAVRYHGGLDSDRKELHDDATAYLRDALDDLLANEPVRRAESKPLGCALQTM
jgi:peroxiredoxin